MLRRGRKFGSKREGKSHDEKADTQTHPNAKRFLVSHYKSVIFLFIFIVFCIFISNLIQVNENLPNNVVESALPMTTIDVTSIGTNAHLFDCSRRQNATCHFLSPIQFFSENQPGYKYLPNMEKMGSNLVNLPRMTYFEWQKSDNTTSAIHNLPHQLSYFHLRKTGGTTIHHALGHLARYMREKMGVETTITRHSTCRGVLREKCQKRALEHIQSIYNQQSTLLSSTDSKHVVFAVVRDPVDRFISAMGQAMQNADSNKLQLRKKCLDESSSNRTVNCVLQHLQEYGLKTDVHFVPMAVNLYALARGMDIQVALLSQENLPNILGNFGQTNNHGMHMRDRSNQAYLNSAMLSKLSTSDLDNKAIKTICELYAVDVKMMVSIGFRVPLCEGLS